MKRTTFWLMALFCLIGSPAALARHFVLPDNGSSLLGETTWIYTQTGDTPARIAERYNLGVNAILAANPGTTESTVFPGGTSLRIAASFLLPSLPHKGIVINLPEMRLYYYLPDSNQLMTFPIGIGKIGKTIPILRTQITRKTKDPVWIPPAGIRQFNAEQGIELPKVMPAGPDNPLGPYAIYLKLPTYLIHSTIFPDSIGRRASFGCIRMNEEDIRQFFPIATPGTLVEIVDMPNKTGWSGDALYLEAHPPLEERRHHANASLTGIMETVEKQLSRDEIILVNWQLIASIASQPDGVPHVVGVKIRAKG